MDSLRRGSGLAFALVVASCSSPPATEVADGGTTAAVTSAPRARVVLEDVGRRAAFASLVRPELGLERQGAGFRVAGFAPVRGQVSISIPERADNPIRVGIEGQSDTWIEVAPLDVAAVAAAVDGNGVVFADAAPSLDLVYLADRGAVEEIRVLRDAHAPTSARYVVRTGPGIATVRAREGRIEAVDATGYVQVATAPIFAVDAKGTTRDATVTVAREGDHFVARVSVDVAGLVHPIAVDPGWSATPIMKYMRRSHAAALLADGRVLVTGGVPGSGLSLSTAEIYDPTANTWTEKAATKYTHSYHRLIPVASNRVVLVGTNSKVELYDVAANTWTEMTPRPTFVSDGHSAVALSATTVLVMGGYEGSTPSAKAELFDVTANAWTARANMPTGRSEFVAAAYASGKILVAGGTTPTGITASATVYDIASNTWTATGSMANARRNTDAAVVSGNVIVAGGYDGSDNLSTSERWTASAGTWATLAALPNRDTGMTLTAVGAADVLKVGAGSAVYSELAAKWVATTPMAFGGRGGHQAVKLTSGKVLVMGGGSGTSLSSAEIYDHVVLGTACTATTQCSMGACVDGRCCDSACTGTCSACDLTGKLGVCSPVSGTAPRGSRGTCGSYVLCAAGACATSCSTDAECASTHYCTGAGGTCQPKKTQGTACGSATQCQSGLFCTNGFCCNSATCGTGTSCGNAGSTGTCTKNLGVACTTLSECGSKFCVDGVCCADACTGGCRACSAAKKGSGTDGTCGSIADGSDPDKDCPPAACKDATTVSNAQVCNGAGMCRASTDTACTAGYRCTSGACATTCTSDAQCASGFFCDASACVLKRDNGAACTAATQCKTGTCADSVCCDVPCAGCNACSAAKKGSGVDGTCGPAAADTDPHNACAPDVAFPASCKADGACDGAGACRVYAKASTSCDVTTCSAATVVGKVCNGAGSCNPTTGTSCAPYGCNTAGTACATTCTKDADCAATAFCTSTGACQPKHGSGEACGAAKECTSDVCADGVCCDKTCGGQCEACDVEGKRGTCSPVTGTPHGARTACAAAGTTCGGTCDGAVTATCSYPGSTRSCGTTCEGDKETRSACDSKGACVAAAPITCGSYRCDGTSKCRGTCTVSDDCAAGFACEGSTCQPATAKCSGDLSTSTSPTDGRATPCGAYLCDPSRGVCRDQCLASAECASGFVCDPASKTCNAASDSGSEDSGGCSASRGTSSSGASAGLLLLVAVALQRRRAAYARTAPRERKRR